MEDEAKEHKSWPEGDDIVKSEYIIRDYTRKLAVDCLSENDRAKLEGQEPGPEKKRRRLAKKLKGQNKDRPITFRESKDGQFCTWIVDSVVGKEEKVCPYSEKCEFQHDRRAYLEKKPKDVGETCYVYSVRGHCPRGISCRFGSQHLTDTGENIVDEERLKSWEGDPSKQTLNALAKETQVSLRKKHYDFTRSEEAIKLIDGIYNVNFTRKKRNGDKEGEDPGENEATKCGDLEELKSRISQRDREKKKIDWRGKLYLAPLTTVGNLPFRRVCRDLGADITCGEMAMAASLLQGQTAEWALIKRHASEETFGVQICGNNQYVMTRCAQVLQEKSEIDFIDVNLGCPLDFVHDQGSGSGLLRRDRMLSNVVRCMDQVLDIPLTVKTRTGVSSSKNIAHTLMPMFRDAGVSLITVHGRSKEQRYSRSADWSYIEECAKIASPTPLFGNGDVLSYVDYETALEKCPSVAGVMIARGALIKPWIFTEIKEKRHMDPSSSERLDILKKYANYGLEHWGSDTRGIETTRRFMLEWLSFLHRYVPTGLLVAPPQAINLRPPHFRGRDDLETLMASPSCSDWVKISEMLLGPVPDGFTFLPKHKASAWK